MGNFLLFFNISGGEILLIIVVVYLVFGPKKIPELARMLGKGINELRRATDDIRKEINREANKIKKDINLDVDDPLEEITKRRKKEETQADKEKSQPKENKQDVKKTNYTEPANDGPIPREYTKKKKSQKKDNSSDETGTSDPSQKTS